MSESPVDPVVAAQIAAQNPDTPLPELIELFSRAFPLARTSNPSFLRSFAMLLHRANAKHTEQSLALLEQANSLTPYDSDLLAELGAAYSQFARFDECFNCFNESLRINPNQSTARWNRSLELLARGEWGEGWQDYQYGRVIGNRPTRSPLPEWDGSQIHGKKVLYLWCEQGLGDTIMMLRFVKKAREWAGPNATIIVEIQPELLPIFSTIEGADKVVCIHPTMTFQCGEKDPQHASLMSLPRILGITPDSMEEFPYPQAFYNREPREDKKIRVGVVWQGSKGHVNDSSRSMTFSLLENAYFFDGMQDRFEFVCLQQDTRAIIHFEKPDLTTFSETFQVLKTLDIVVGVDTSVCHLAGAMAIPTLLMIAKTSDYRWLRDTEKTPWYPNHYLFRQSVNGEWSDVIQNVRITLQNFAESKRPGTTPVQA